GLESVGALSKAYSQYLLRALEQMEQVTLALKYDWEQSRSTLSLHQLRALGLYTAPQYAVVAIFDQHGEAVTATVPFGRLHTSAAAEYLARHAVSRDGAMHIGLDRGGEAQPLIHFTRRLEDRHGGYAGVLVIAVDPSYFSQFYDSSHFGRYSLSAMVDGKGELYSARIGGGAGAEPPRGPLFKDSRFLAAKSGAIASPGKPGYADGQSRFLAWQAVKNYPFTAVIGLADAEVLRSYQETRAMYLGIAGAVSGLLLLFTGVASTLSIRLALRQQQSEGVRNAYRMATEGTSDGFYIVAALRDGSGAITDFELVDCNEPGADFFGVKREQLLGMRLRAREQEPYFRDLMRSYREAMVSGFSETEVELAEGNPFNLRWIRRRLVRSGDRLAVTLQDISGAKSHEEELRRLANEDGLTGLPNRHWLNRFLPGALERARAGGDMLALLFIDLDGFKDINDTGGHGEGDKVLRAAAQRLQSVLRPGDHVVRIGGDEFVVILDPLDFEGRVARVAERIAEAFEEPFPLAEGKCGMGASVGISLFPRDGDDTETLLKNADIAMYAVKMAGKGHHRFYQPELYEVIRSRRETEQSLITALEEDQFVVHYQPRVDTRTGRLCSMEALVRWRHPQQGLLPPLEFISIAESSGLIARLGETVVEKVCRQLAQWQAQGLALVPVSINVSAHQFGRGDVHLMLAAAMARHRIAARLIEVEITESAMMGDHSEAVQQLAAIRGQGVKMLVDDFGSGYSSLSQLQKFAMDGLKIDRAFTMELGKSRQGEIFVGAILSMAHALGMRVVAEGVETLQQLDILRQLQCNEVQGYLISQPVTAENMRELMKKRFLIAPAQVFPAPSRLSA
ncbi:MAG TPA: signal transduction protein, partial [Janthinobacterium sp.]|nr:signal transduction protein [Janthinobacterium sp.]